MEFYYDEEGRQIYDDEFEALMQMSNLVIMIDHTPNIICFYCSTKESQSYDMPQYTNANICKECINNKDLEERIKIDKENKIIYRFNRVNDYLHDKYPKGGYSIRVMKNNEIHFIVTECDNPEWKKIEFE